MLDTTTAENAVYELLEDQMTRLDNFHLAHRDYAKELVRIMADLIRSGLVTGTVSTTGTAAAQTGTITSGTIS